MVDIGIVMGFQMHARGLVDRGLIVVDRGVNG